MHDPTFLAFDIRPFRLDVWHDEPGGRDAFTVCGRPPQRGTARLLWTIRHTRHLHFRWWPYLNIRRWVVDRCADCGRRFLRRDARHSYQSSDAVYHDVCMSLRHVRGQLDDITGYLRGTADSNARWRVEYRLKGLDDKAVSDTAPNPLEEDRGY
jgi:hypothetical protein